MRSPATPPASLTPPAGWPRSPATPPATPTPPAGPHAASARELPLQEGGRGRGATPGVWADRRGGGGGLPRARGLCRHGRGPVGAVPQGQRAAVARGPATAPKN